MKEKWLQFKLWILTNKLDNLLINHYNKTYKKHNNKLELYEIKRNKHIEKLKIDYDKYCEKVNIMTIKQNIINMELNLIKLKKE